MADIRPGTGYVPAQRMGGAAIGVVGQPEQFNLQQYSAGQGTPTRTPTGLQLPTDPQSYAQVLEQEYGVTQEEFAGMRTDEQYQAWAQQRGLPGTYEEYQQQLGDNGMPTRPPESPQEAHWAQFAAGEAAQAESRQLLQNAVSTMQYAFGLLRQGGQGSLGSFMQPQMQQLANIYASTEVQQPDFSAWQLPGAHGVFETPEPIEPVQDIFAGMGMSSSQQPTTSAFGRPGGTGGVSYAGGSWL